MDLRGLFHQFDAEAEDRKRVAKMMELRRAQGFPGEAPIEMQGDANLGTIFTDSMPVSPDVWMEKYKPFLYRMMQQAPNGIYPKEEIFNPQSVLGRYRPPFL